MFSSLSFNSSIFGKNFFNLPELCQPCLLPFQCPLSIGIQLPFLVVLLLSLNFPIIYLFVEHILLLTCSLLPFIYRFSSLLIPFCTLFSCRRKLFIYIFLLWSLTLLHLYLPNLSIFFTFYPSPRLTFLWCFYLCLDLFFT